ncbi:MAG: Mut7-C RNAse domain-containing protein, partial [Proteobacteria bacterium]|nr:Mut7-C RNAse domain-containing protein [Pseudomonadota bacterium]
PEQLRQCCQELGIKCRPENLFTRCARCNEPLEEVGRESVMSRVPEYVYETQEHFRTCPGCGRIYWAGTHPERMLRFLESIGLERT